jgi:hypothetical protein
MLQQQLEVKNECIVRKRLIIQGLK